MSSQPAPAPELATIVIGYRAPAEIVGAVRSLREQSVATDILVVNSGGGDIGALLRRHGLDVAFVEFKERLYVGAARNRGIERTRAPYVAFLADDCRAAPGWVERRLARHKAGAPVVASAVINSKPQNLVACAAHLSLFMRRLPGLPEEQAIRYGASFERGLFARHGLYDETMATGEDSEFLLRLPAELKPAWDGDIRTVHLNETRILRLLIDQYQRGTNYGREMHRLSGKSLRKIARDVLRQHRPARQLAMAGLSGDELIQTLRAMPILRLSLLAKAAGALMAADSRDKSVIAPLSRHGLRP
ncbi:glycosyltransferase family A protein [Aminobacter sp. NyZ550]|uniref:glycosyltransferase family 2 protein n=1 Tax=Aminobacter sp. NyZ550 TaxID=2979870 RepID=UPI0021D5BD3D|nr:glycosyltransferase family A protein [Aminobacter sp. NyZ550]WAX92819.1 glycosyltransferase family A protein [Aminobacter sp. NyZ550]